MICLLLLCLTACAHDAPTIDEPAIDVNAIASDLRVKYAPDSRTDRLVLERRGNGLTGYTTSEEMLDGLNKAIAGRGLINNVRLLPDTAVGDRTVGIINVSVANLRSKSGHSQELATQALLGTPVQLLDLVDGWYLVRTPDRYLAWLEPGALVAMTLPEARSWLDGDLRLYVGDAGVVRSGPEQASPVVSDIVTGGIVEYLPSAPESRLTSVSLPDGTTGWLPESDLLWAPAWLKPRAVAPEELIAAANAFAGRPYLWGGTSSKGMDCSGFTKMVYYLNGHVIPRDASQQVHAGTEVELTDDFANLAPGDLLFFGRFREDGSEKITHTGIYLGDGRFIHAGADNGRIRTNSLVPEREDFADHRLASLLRARRLAAGSTGVTPVAQAFVELVNGSEF